MRLFPQVSRVVLILATVFFGVASPATDSAVDRSKVVPALGLHVLQLVKSSDKKAFLVDRISYACVFKDLIESRDEFEDKSTLRVNGEEFRKRLRRFDSGVLEVIYNGSSGYSACICVPRSIKKYLATLRTTPHAHTRNDDVDDDDDEDSLNTSGHSAASLAVPGAFSEDDEDDPITPRAHIFRMNESTVALAGLKANELAQVIDAALCLHHQGGLSSVRFSSSITDLKNFFAFSESFSRFLETRLCPLGTVAITDDSVSGSASFSSPARVSLATIMPSPGGCSLEIAFSERNVSSLKSGLYEVHFSNQGSFDSAGELLAALNKLGKELDEDFELSEVQVLHLNGTHIGTLTPEFTDAFESMTELYACYCGVSNVESEVFNSNLEILDLSHNELEELDCANFAKAAHSSLRIINLVGCNLERLPKNIRLCSNLESLDLSQNNISGESEDEGVLSGLDKLSGLALEGNKLTTISWLRPVLEVHNNCFARLLTKKGEFDSQVFARKVLHERHARLQDQLSALKGESVVDGVSAEAFHALCTPFYSPGMMESESKGKTLIPKTESDRRLCWVVLLTGYEAVCKAIPDIVVPWDGLPVDIEERHLAAIAETIDGKDAGKTIDAVFTSFFSSALDRLLESINGTLEQCAVIVALDMQAEDDSQKCTSGLPYISIDSAASGIRDAALIKAFKFAGFQLDSGESPLRINPAGK